MDRWKPFEVVVPGSTANLGSGFDSLGMAVDRFLRLRISPSDRMRMKTRGGVLEQVDLDDNNLILRVMREAFREKGRRLPPLLLEAESDIPLMRGLGSSAAAIVAGWTAANRLLGNPWSREELLQRATRTEGHPDNVGASLYGGVVITSWDGRHAHLLQAETPPLTIVAAVPLVSLATSEARHVLPEHLTHGEAVLGSSRANLLTAALLTGNWEALRVGMNDRFHQPYRLSLVPGLQEMLEGAYRHGALGAALSGAGPTVIAFTLDPESVSEYMEDVFQNLSVPADIFILRPYDRGAVVGLTNESDRSTLLGNL
ncbi:homoserine kinase [Paludifilum halophilum]|nr:homoserine kinase [Paludifilum halophilum]